MHLDVGNFETAAQVKDAVQKIYVWGKPLKEAENQVFPLHISVYDAQGNGIVIEWVKEGLRIYDHADLGVLTNSPPFDWHLINIRNYLNIRAAEVQPVKMGDAVLAPPGQGSGGQGLPGDWTSPSRLVRCWFMQRYAKPVEMPRQESTWPHTSSTPWIFPWARSGPRTIPLKTVITRCGLRLRT